MISPSEIASKLERLYPKAARAVLNHEVDFFPHRLRVDWVPSSDIARAIRVVETLRNASKSSVGHGYSIHWQPRRSRSLGQNDFPEAILVESMEDLVRAVGKQRSWQRLLKAVEILRSRHPSLHPWVIQNWQRLDGIERRFARCPAPVALRSDQNLNSSTGLPVRRATAANAFGRSASSSCSCSVRQHGARARSLRLRRVVADNPKLPSKRIYRLRSRAPIH